MTITLTPAWIALEAQCTTPALIERYNKYTIQLLNGYMGFGLAIDHMQDAINKSGNPYIGKTVVELIKLRHPVQDALYAYPFPKGDRAIELVRTLNQINEAERVATKEKNFGV